MLSGFESMSQINTELLVTNLFNLCERIRFSDEWF